MIIKTGREGKERRGSLVIRIIICPAGMPWISFPGEAWLLPVLHLAAG